MDLAHLVAFNLTLLAAFLSPGPAMLCAVAATMRDGQGAGIATGAGLGAMAAGWTLAALLGLDALFAVVPWAYGALKTVGAAYLIWIAWKTWAGAREPVGTRPLPARRAVLNGVLINLTNPKSVLFSAAVLIVIFPSGLGAAEMTIIVVDQFVFELLGYAIIATVLSREGVRRRYLSLKVVFDRAAAVVLGALGVRLLLSR